MDTSYEGGSPMQPTVINMNTPAVQPQSVQSFEMSQDQEVVLSREVDQKKPEVVQAVNNHDMADILLADSKKMGIGTVLENLALGKYRDGVLDIEDTDFKEGEILDEVERRDPTLDERKHDVLSYVVEQSASDPLMQQKLGEVACEMIANGQDINPEILQEEAFKRYVEEKDKQEGFSLEEKVLSIEEQFADLLNENDELRAQLQEFKGLVKQQSETMQTMALALLELAKKLHKEKEDEKEKTSLLELLILLMGAFLQEMSSSENDKQGKNTKLDISKLAILSKNEAQK